MKRMASLAAAQLLDDLLEALLELAAVLGAGHQRTDVQGQDTLVGQALGDVPADDAVRQAFGDGRLADTGLADEGRVVLAPARQDLDDALDLLLAADDRVQLAGAGGLREVDAELVHGRRLAAAALRLSRAGARCAGLAEDADDLVANLVEVDAERLQHAGRDALTLAHEAQEQVLRADVVVAQAASLVDGQLDDTLGARGQADLTDDRAVATTDDELDRGAHLGQLDVHVLEHAGSDALAFPDEAEQEVLRADVVVVEALGLILRQGEDLARAVSELVEPVHGG